MTSVTVLLPVAALATSLLSAAPAAGAEPAPVPVVAGPTPGDRSATQSARRDLGHTRAPDGVLRAGCRNYPYRYVVKVRTDDWMLETFLTDRTGEAVASGTYASGPDTKRMRSRFRLCRYTTEPGRFTIRAKLRWFTDAGDHQAWLKPAHFRLRRP